MTKRKIILFIVEGVSDKTALSLVLSRIFDSNVVKFAIMYGDITSDYDNTVGTIASVIGDKVKEFAGKQFKAVDFAEVVHIIDTDGVFIPDDNVLYDKSADEVKYRTSNIFTKNVDKIRHRNEHKRAIISKMLGTSKVWRTIPYSVYYFSCNLEHVISRNANMADEIKGDNAEKFEKKFANNVDGFRIFFEESDFAVKGEYADSWKFIKTGNNSLKRYSNFGLFLEKPKNKL